MNVSSSTYPGRETIEKIVAKVSTAIRFMALFSLAMGIPVLFSAVAATRRDRIREGVLLKTLGASRGQIMKILLAEYALLGLLGSMTGMVLAIGGGWALTKFVFDATFSPALVPAFLCSAGVTLQCDRAPASGVFQGDPDVSFLERDTDALIRRKSAVIRPWAGNPHLACFRYAGILTTSIRPPL